MSVAKPDRKSRSLIVQLAAIHACIGLLALVLGTLVLHKTLTRVVWNQHQRSILASGAEVERRLRREGLPGLAHPFSPETTARFDSATGSMRYAVLDRNGALLAASPGAESALPRLEDGKPLATFQTGRDGSLAWGITQEVGTPQGSLLLQVAQDMSRSYIVLDDVPLAALEPMVAVLAAGAVLLFGANAALLILMLRPVRRAAREAERIGQAGPARLDARGMPRELRPLIVAVNGGLDRLDEALGWQRGFSEEVAHELRTPLAIILAELDLFEPSPARERLRRDVAELSRLVADLLEAAEATRVTPAYTGTFDLTELVAQTAERLALLAQRDGRTVIGPTPTEPIRVVGDRDAIARVLRNLVENALAHSPAGASVELRLKQRPGEAMVDVADHGPGVPPAERDLVFRRRWRAGDTHRMGLGLGLSIVEQIVRVHGGRVAVGDNPGGGAVFTVVLPCGVEPAAE